MLEIAQAAVYQFGAGRRRGAGQIALLGKQHLQSAAGRVRSNAASVDAAADDDEIIGRWLMRAAGLRSVPALALPALARIHQHVRKPFAPRAD